jgi:hypothetical protein
MIDMLHMGFVDEIIFGREIFKRLPKLVNEWKTAYAGATHNRKLKKDG